MRHWLTLLLLAVLPLQFAWAAAAAYCQHETSASVRHIGHHAHEHKAVGNAEAEAGHDAPDGAKASQLSVDSDCGYCHLGTAKPVRALSTTVVAVAGPHNRETAALAPRTRDPDRFERPKWRLA